MGQFPEVLPGTPLPWRMFDGWGPFANDGLMRAKRIGNYHGGLTVANGGDIIGSREDFEYLADACNAYPALRTALAGVLERLKEAEAGRASILSDEHRLSAAYLRLRLMIPGALATPTAPTSEQVWQTTEDALAVRLAESERQVQEARRLLVRCDVWLGGTNAHGKRAGLITEKRDTLLEDMHREMASWEPSGAAPPQQENR